MTISEKNKVFISHAHEDKPIAQRIAESLMSQGIDVWFDKWEINPGDSLVQKVFTEGLRDCKVFMILLSETSVKSSWVMNELDVAVINRISGITKILPVVVGRCEIPTPLKALLWIDMSVDFDAGMKRIVDTIFGVTTKPPLGPVPIHIEALERQVDGLTKIATAIALIFLQTSDASSDYQLGVSGNDLTQRLPGLTPQDINDGVDELEEMGLIKTRKYLGTAPFDFAEIYPTYFLYIHLREEGLGYDPEEDIKIIAAAVTARGSMNGGEIQVITGLPIIRINRAVSYLEDRGLVDVLNYLGTAPYDFGSVSANRRTRQLPL